MRAAHVSPPRRLGVHTGRVFRVRAVRVRVYQVSALEITYRTRPKHFRVGRVSGFGWSGCVGSVSFGFRVGIWAFRVWGTLQKKKKNVNSSKLFNMKNTSIWYSISSTKSLLWTEEHMCNFNTWTVKCSTISSKINPNFSISLRQNQIHIQTPPSTQIRKPN